MHIHILIVFLTLIFSINNAFAQQAPSRNDASAEYCLVQEDHPCFVRTKVVKSMPSLSLSANDTLWCSFYASTSWTDFDYPGHAKMREGLLGGGGACFSTRLGHSIVKGENGDKVKSEPMEIKDSECPLKPHSATISIDFPKVQYIFLSDSITHPDSLIKSFTGMVLPAHWKVPVICKPKNDTTLTRSSYIYITGPCPKGMKIPEPEEEIEEEMDQEE
jgi:hypothetical protein